MNTRRIHKVTSRPTLLEMSAAQRLGLALIACAVVWAAIGVALI
jgi:hypothetical protein